MQINELVNNYLVLLQFKNLFRQAHETPGIRAERPEIVRVFGIFVRVTQAGRVCFVIDSAQQGA